MTTIKLRRGVAAQWTIANPVLAQGEPGFEDDTGKFKIGDGTKHWVDLEYLVTETLLSEALDASELTASGYATDAQNISIAYTNSALSTVQTALHTYADNAVSAEATARATAITNAINALVNGAPGALNTLNEIATQMASDESAAGAITTLVTAIRGLTDTTLAGNLNTFIDARTKPSGVVNPITGWIHAEQNGCVGDGTTDDTTAFQAMLTLARGGSGSQGRPIYAPKKYLISSTLVIDQPIMIMGSGSMGSGGSGTIFRNFSGNLFRIESNFVMRDFFIYDSSGDNTRTGAALAFRAVFDATTGMLSRTAGFCRFDNVRISSSTAGTTSAWERIIDADGSNGWISGDNAHAPGGTLPPLRDVVFTGCLFFGGRTANDTIRLNRVAHWQFIGGIHDPAPATTVVNGITVSADSTDVQFIGFEAIANLDTAGAKVSWAGGNLGANNGAALTIQSTATYTQIMCPINGSINNLAPETATVKIVTTQQTIPQVFRANGTTLGSSPVKWGHGNTNYRNSLGVMSGGGYGFMSLHSEHSSTANLLKNDDSGIRGFAVVHSGVVGSSVSFLFGDTTVAGATWTSMATCEALRLRYGTVPGADIGRTPAGNWLTLDGSVTTGTPSVAAAGADTNVTLNLASKGTGIINLNVSSGSGTGGFRSGDGAGNPKFKVNSSGGIDLLSGTSVQVKAAAGSPEGVLAAVVGSVYLRTDGARGSTMYVKESGSGNTGWVAKTQPVVNVMDYGAVQGSGGSAATNDTAIAAAIAVLSAYTGGFGGGVVYFPAGQYNISTAITLTSGMTIRGASKHSTYVTGAIAGPMITSSGTQPAPATYCSIENIYINNTSTNIAATAASFTWMNQLLAVNTHFQAACTGSNSRVVYGDGVFGFLAQWCHFTGTGPDRALDFDGTNSNTIITVRDCSLMDAKAAARFVHVESLGFRGNHIENIQGSPVGGNSGVITFDATNAGDWGGNYFEACTGAGIICYAAVGTSRSHTFDTNRFFNISGTALTLTNLKYGFVAPQQVVPGPLGVNIHGVLIGGSDNVTVCTPYLASGTGTALDTNNATNCTVLPLTAKRGSSATNATLVAGTVTIADTSITANSEIRVWNKTIGGTPGALYISAKNAGVGFTITSTSASDTSVVRYEIISY